MPLIRKSDKDTSKPESKPVDVLAALTKGTPDERWAAARAAAPLAGAVAALAAALSTETDARVREAMFTSLTRIGTPESVSAIIPLLRVDDANLRTGALDALRAMPGAVREYLPVLLNDGDSDVRNLTCEIVRGLPGEEATTILCELLAREPEANVCAAAIDVLAEVGGPTALPALAACAERFPNTSFLTFAIKIARDRLMSQSPDSHG
ncbi:MAG: HEAT repeat domain-containing protein [Pseudomonadota bacterium]